MKKGFTLIEVMMAVGLFLLIVAGTLSVYIMCMQTWHSTSLKMETTHSVSLAIARMVYGLGTNNGLRTAAKVVVDPAFAGVYLSWKPPTNYPPPANADNHWIASYPGDGSWRITSSNEFDGTKWIDYNINARNIVYWPNITDSSSRQLICNYVESATASNTSDGIFISITIVKEDGRFDASNTVSTFVKIRNK